MRQSGNGLYTLGLLSKQHAAHTPIRHISLVKTLEFEILLLILFSNPAIAYHCLIEKKRYIGLGYKFLEAHQND